MELRQLKYFKKAADLLNFTEAARSLFVSQSTLSQQIKQLENELEILLFDRIGKSVVLTEAGQLFLSYARKTIKDSEDGKQIISDLQSLKTGELHIGATYSLSFLLTTALIEFSEKYPQIKLFINYSTSYELEDKLNRNEVDFILSLEHRENQSQFESVPLFSSNLHLVISRNHRLATAKFITLKELSQEALILPAKGFITRVCIDELFSQKELTPNVQMEFNDVNSILRLVSIGRWGTILTHASVRNEPELVAVPIISKGLQTHASLFWARGVYRKKSATKFAEILSRIGLE